MKNKANNKENQYSFKIKENPKNTLLPIKTNINNVSLYSRDINKAIIDGGYLSALTNKEIFERVFKNSQIMSNNSMILDYLSLKKENIENRVFRDNSKAWDWKFDYRNNEYSIPESGIYYISYFKLKYF